MKIDLSQELLLGYRIDLVIQSLIVRLDSRIFNVELFELVIRNVSVHLENVLVMRPRAGEMLAKLREGSVFKRYLNASDSSIRHAMLFPANMPSKEVSTTSLCSLPCSPEIDVRYPRNSPSLSCADMHAQRG